MAVTAASGRDDSDLLRIDDVEEIVAVHAGAVPTVMRHLLHEIAKGDPRLLSREFRHSMSIAFQVAAEYPCGVVVYEANHSRLLVRLTYVVPLLAQLALNTVKLS